MIPVAFFLSISAGFLGEALMPGFGGLLAIAVMGSFILWAIRYYCSPADEDDGEEKKP